MLDVILAYIKLPLLGCTCWVEDLTHRDGNHGEAPALVLTSSVMRVALSHVKDLTQGEVPMTEVQDMEMKEVRGVGYSSHQKCFSFLKASVACPACKYSHGHMHA